MAVDNPNTRSPEYVITLVHGTFAKNAGWTKEDSAMSKALKERFGSKAKVCTFNWTGKNSVTGRYNASEELKIQLVNQLKENDRAHDYLISHSHGGSVALKALEADGLWDKISGIVCLATPFLIARKRDFGRNIRNQLIGAFSVPLIFVFWFVYHRFMPSGWPGLEHIVISILASAVAGSFLLSFIGLIFFQLIKKWNEYAGILKSKVECVTTNPSKVLIIRSTGDEAYSALAHFQFISQLSMRLYLRSFSLFEMFENSANRWTKQKRKMLATAAVAFVTYLSLILLLVALQPLWPDDSLEYWVPRTVLIGSFLSLLISIAAFLLFCGRIEPLPFIFLVTSGAVIWPTINLISIILLPFGWEIALANILLDVTVEATPLGLFETQLIEPPTSEEFGKDVLPINHSVIYENPKVLLKICDWIENGK